MSSNEPDLVVGRNFAHVWELVKKYPHAEVITTESFFRRVSQLAFLADERLLRDDAAPLIIAQEILAETKAYPLSLAQNFASLYSALLQGGCHIRSVRSRFDKANAALKRVVDIAALIEERMGEKSLANPAKALYLSWTVLRRLDTLPQTLACTRRVHFYFPMDLTALEVSILKDLGALGMTFGLIFPADFLQGEVNTSIDFIVQQVLLSPNIEVKFEDICKNKDIKYLVSNFMAEEASITLSKKNCSVTAADQLEEEALLIAQRIAQIKSEHPQAQIALTVRSRDARLEVYKRALLAHGITIDDRSGLRLLQSRFGILLSTLFSARLSHLSRRDLLGLIQHHQFAFCVKSPNGRADLNRLLDKVGVDDNILYDYSACRYEGRFAKYRQFLNAQEAETSQVDGIIDLVFNTKNIINLLKEEDSFLGFLSALEEMLHRATLEEGRDETFYAILKSIIALKNSQAFNTQSSPKITIYEFLTLLKSAWQGKTLLDAGCDDSNAISVLLLPEILGRTFDCVFIADMAFGRIPQNFAQDPLLNDELRLELNQILQAFVLPTSTEDPFAPRPEPSRQAMEPFWLASAMASAQSGLFFSYARHDLSGQEQVACAYFEWLKKSIRLDLDEKQESSLQFTSRQKLRFLQGKSDRQNPPELPNLVQKALHQREQAFKEREADAFAFLFDQQDIGDSFAGLIGPNASRALTPTFIESFASCRFKGFYQRILRIDEAMNEGDDMDMRAQGQIAHKTLEIFFAEPLHDLNRIKVDKRVNGILAVVIKQFRQKNYIKNDAVFACQSDWLKEALVNLVLDIAFQRPALLSRAPRREVALGLGALPPLPVKFAQRHYLLGGIVDRIDEIDGDFWVMDYKLSSVANLKAATSPRETFKTHFQMPIYLRLVSQFFAHNDPAKVSFSFASIRDGELLKPYTFQSHSLLFERIFADDDPDGLVAQIDAIFAPIEQGKVLAQVSDRCSHCALGNICRKDEVR